MLRSNFTQQRVLIVGDGSLFESCVTYVLTDDTDFVVTRQTYSDDLVFLNTIKLNKPDVILVCESSSFDPSRILDLVSSHSMAVELPIFVVRLYKNMIDVYEDRTPSERKKSPTRKRIITRTGADLRNAIRRKYNDQ